MREFVSKAFCFKNKTFILTILIIFTVITLSLNVAMINLFKYQVNSTNYFYLIIIIINFLMLISMFSGYYALNNKYNKDNYKSQLNNSNQIVQILRKQKHDFNNHINVISGYLQLNKVSKALNYVFEISDKSDDIFTVAKIKNPIIASSLYNKLLEIKSFNIETELYINSSLRDIHVSSKDILYILLNLIDNSIKTLRDVDCKEKLLTIDIDEFDDKFNFSIINSCYFIKRDEYGSIFSKNNDMNMFNIKKLIEKYNGSLSIESNDEFGTIYIISFPKKTIEK